MAKAHSRIGGVVLLALTACDRPASERTVHPPIPSAVGAPSSTTAAVASPPTPTSPGERSGRLGTNLTRATYYAQAWPFVDVIRHADPWISGRPEHPDVNKRWNDGGKVALDARGWVTKLEAGQVARKFVFASQTHFRTGRYTVLHRGQGQLDYRGSVKNLTRGPTKDTFDLGPGEGLWLELTSTDAKDPLRELHVLPPGGRCSNDARAFCSTSADCSEGSSCELFVDSFEKKPFHPDFLADVGSASVLRFMDWMDTNRPASPSPDDPPAPPVREISEWTHVDDAVHYPVPFERIIALSNELQTDAWITIPHEASDAFVRVVAAQFARDLAPGLRVHVEYSNEVWNGMFGQAVYANQNGCRRFSKNVSECDEDGDGVLCEPGPWSDVQARCLAYGRRFHAHRSAQILRLFEAAFGADARSRLVRVVAWQTGSLMDAGAEMLREDVGGEPLAKRVDVFAVAPYFGGDFEQMPDPDVFFQKTTKESYGAPEGTFRVLAESANGREAGVYFYLASDAKILARSADLRHLKLVAYEGGQHLFSFHDGQGPRIRALNVDARMQALYAQYLDTFAQLTGDALFVHYGSPGAWWQHGAFGSKEWQGQPLAESPKHAALEQFARAPRASR